MSTTGTTDETPDPAEVKQLHELVTRAEAGDDAARDELRTFVAARPGIWGHVGDLAAQAEEAWLVLIAGQDEVLRASVAAKAAALRAELAGDDPPPLERLLVDRVVAGWLQVHYSDAIYAQFKGPQATLARDAAAIRRQSAAQARYLQAVRALATVRKLLRPLPSPVELAARLGGGVASKRLTVDRLPKEAGLLN